MTKYKKFLEWSPIIISIIALVISLYAIEETKNIASKYQAAVEPALDFYIYSSYNFPELSALDIANVNIYGTSGEEINLCVKNKGQTNSGHVTALLIDNWSSSPYWNFDTVMFGEEPKCLNQRIVASTCEPLGINETYKNCNPSNIPEGLVKLTFKIDCKNCEAGKKIYLYDIPVCIWHKDNSICKRYNSA